MRTPFARRIGTAAAVLGSFVLAASPAFGQPPPLGGGSAETPREAAPIDLTGQWVSIVTEDWRYRMVGPEKGELGGLMLTPAGQAAAEAWDPAGDAAEGAECKAYGAGNIMRVPGRIRISWEGDTTLRVETDAGRQVRLFHFGRVPEPTEPTLQGLSRAEWIMHGGGRGEPPVNGTLKVVTTDVLPGYLRRNGVPYGERAVITEYIDLLEQPDGTQWIVVKTIVEDDQYLAEPYIVSSNFRKEEDRDAWSPAECEAG